MGSSGDLVVIERAMLISAARRQIGKCDKRIEKRRMMWAAASLDVAMPRIYNGCWPISRAAPGLWDRRHRA